MRVKYGGHASLLYEISRSTPLAFPASIRRRLPLITYTKNLKTVCRVVSRRAASTCDALTHSCIM